MEVKVLLAQEFTTPGIVCVSGGINKTRQQNRLISQNLGI